MSDPSDMTDWMPGQPAPWLAGYGPPPVATTPPAPDQPVQDPGIGLGGVPVPPPAASSPAGPAPESPPGAPTWLQQLTPSFLQQPQAPLADAVSGAAPAPPAAPDAISGPGESGAAPRNPTQDLAQIASDPDAPVTARMDAWQKLPPDVRANIVNNADPKQLAVLSTSAMAPEELATIAVRHQQAQLHEESVRRLALAQQADQEARRSFEAYQAALQQSNASTAQLADEADALSKQKIDPKEHGVGNFVASVLTGAFGGAMMQANGGRNLGLEQLDKRTQERIDAQKADLANQWQGVKFKQNLIGEQVQRSGDLYRAQEAYRISTYDRATAELQTQMQDYDPQGTTALRAAGAVQTIQAQRAQALQAYQQQTFKNRLDAAKVQLDAEKNAQDAANKKIEQQQKQQEIGLHGWEIASANKRAENELASKELDRQETRASRLANQPNGTIGGIPTGIDDSGNVQYGTLTNADGTPFTIKDKDEHQKLGSMVAASFDVNRLANQLANDIAKWGGQSKTLGGAAEQKLEADKEAYIFALHQAEGIEGFRPGTADMIDKLTGGVDVTSWIKTATPGILRARDNINQQVDNALRVRAGYTGPSFAPVDTSTATPTATDEIDSAQEGANTAVPERIPLPGAPGGGVVGTATRAVADLTPVGITRETVNLLLPKSGLSDEQRKNFETLGVQAGSPNAAARKKAAAALGDIASKGETVAEREAAALILSSASAADAAGSASPPDDWQTSAREEP